ncbi:unnamed protein product [Rotaria socialis]|uniref:Uncharacterized protein n=1 Tax=Rotaria socialis TaxID=392032 RepID=A0A817XU91_9BILA|nr:unnamed protein product [Rotaria socialis]CAF4768600.1 unnamed protein product [Rotaria socialis]
MDDDSAHGVRFSGNDQFTIVAINAYEKFLIAFSPYENSKVCGFSYPWEDLYIYSLAVIENRDNFTSSELYEFILVAEDMETQHVHCIQMFYKRLNPSCDGSTTGISYRNEWKMGHQEYMFVKVHPSQNHALVFTDNRIIKFYFNSSEDPWMDISKWKFRTHAIDLTETYAILVGFHVDSDKPHLSKYVAILFHLDTLNELGIVSIYMHYQYTAQALTYNFENDMSVVINSERKMAIIGLPVVNTVVVLSINTTSSSIENWTIQVIHTKISSQDYTDFGRSIAWIDGTTVAVNILTARNQESSQSEVWVFDVDKSFTTPLFIFPNHQQKVPTEASQRFLQILSWSKNLLILTDNNQALLVPSQPAGFFSVLSANESLHVFVFNSAPCVAGTYKNTSDFGPCTVCPPQTKNKGTQPCSKCASCDPTSFCPLAAVGEISFDDYPSYSQAFSYPSKPHMNNYDDLLVHNMFAIGDSRRCILISPLLWTAIVIALCFIVWLLMTLLKICSCPQAQDHRNQAKKFLKKADIFNQGERWVGGLFTLAILLIYTFTFRFASGFLKLYPIETSDVSHISCDDTMRNALFDSVLQLPLPLPDGSQWTIFNMLDTQPFVITIDLLNTAADCSSVTAQQNRPGVNYLRLEIISCVLQPDNITRSVNFSLPSHRTNVQINITGPFFIGGIRLCLYGQGLINGENTLQTLDMCQSFWTANETLSYFTSLNIVLIKVINLTKPLTIGDATHYHGRWAPTFAVNSISDELLYEQDGYHLRYMAERTILAIALNEQPFYLQNIQEPIVRKAELAFHTLLFCTLVLELFGIGFLFFRLIIVPMTYAVLGCCYRKKRNENMEEIPSQRQMVAVVSTQEDVDTNDMGTNVHTSIQK